MCMQRGCLVVPHVAAPLHVYHAGCSRLTSLVKLQASFNRFTALPPCLLKLPKLEMAR